MTFKDLSNAINLIFIAILLEKEICSGVDALRSLIHFIMFQGFYRLGSALMALEQYDRALEILKNGLHTTGRKNRNTKYLRKL